VDPKLSEHGGDVGGRGGSRDRLRTKDRSLAAEGSHSGKIDDGCDGDMNGGIVGVLLGKWDRGVSNGSCWVLMGKVAVAIRGHRAECVVVKELS
jgi:hypothetical protein